MEDFFTRDPHISGSKGLIFIGGDLLVYRRDNNTKNFPFCIDLPGGGVEGDETPYETFAREVKEEFGLTITPQDIRYARRYPSTIEPGKSAYFAVVKLPTSEANNIVFGDEGLEYMLIPLDDYLADKNVAWAGPMHLRVNDYLKSLE